MEQFFPVISSFPLIWNMAHSPDWKTDFWQVKLKQFTFKQKALPLIANMQSCPVWLFTPSLCLVFFVRWQYLGRVRVLSQWVFTWWSRAASICLNRLSCRVCPSPSLWRPGEEPWAQRDSAYWCVTHLLQILWTQRAGKSIFLFFLRWIMGTELLLYSNLVEMSPACLQTTSSSTAILFFIRLFPRHDALKLGKDFAKQTNCSVSNIVCLLSLTPQAVLAAQMKTSRALQTPAYVHQI